MSRTRRCYYFRGYLPCFSPQLVNILCVILLRITGLLLEPYTLRYPLFRHAGFLPDGRHHPSLTYRRLYTPLAGSITEKQIRAPKSLIPQRSQKIN